MLGEVIIMNAKEKAEILVKRFQAESIIEYTSHIGLKPTYSKLNEREAIECAIISANDTLQEIKAHYSERESFWYSVVSELKSMLALYK